MYFKPVIPLLFLILFQACHQQTNILPEPTGATGEVLVVMPDTEWNGIAGDSCRQLFGKPYEMLPQYEPLFDIRHITPDNFKQFLLLHRNVLVADISPSIEENKMTLQYEPYAATQLIITLRAKNSDDFVELLTGSRNRIIDLFNEMELQRIENYNRQHADQGISSRILRDFGISITIPDGYTVALDTTNFIWLIQETNSIIQGIIIYRYAYTSGRGLTSQNLVEMRDAMVNRYIPGEVTGSYMTTEKEFPPLTNNILLHGKLPAVEVRGLWKTVNGTSMGGPFVSISIPRNEDKEVLTVEGFAFAAGYKKRIYMRKAMAVILSTTF